MNITHKYNMNKVLKTLTIKALHINEVDFSNDTKLDKSTLFIENQINIEDFFDISKANINIISPNNRNVSVNSILDIIPISTKVYGTLGTGITHTLTGVYVLLTASINEETQVKNFGCCCGNLKDIVKTNKIGTYGDSDYLIHIDVTIKDDSNVKESITNCHLICEKVIKKIRKQLKTYDGKSFDETHVYEEKVKKDCKRVVLIKQLSGQGAMENNIILPNEPSGIEGGKSIMEYQNTPIIISPNEYRDGAIRALN